MKVLNVLIFILIFNTFILLGYLTSTFTGKAIQERISVNITRVIDGDTIVYETKGITQHCRLLGINTPEKKQPFHDEAMNFLKTWEGRQVELESRGQDKYGRTLGYIFFNNELINTKQLENGFANLYVYDKDENYQALFDAEQKARDAGIGLWKKSQNYGCLEIVKFQYIEQQRCKNQEQLVLNNKCNEINAILKDDANHIYDEAINPGMFSMNFSCVWNDAGDTLAIRDESGLILWKRY